MTNSGAADDRLKLVYDEAVRAINQQYGSLDEVRARTGYVLSAASISAAFLGATALTGSSSWYSNLANGVAVAGFVGVGILMALVLKPEQDWVFKNSARATLASYVDGPNPADINGMYRELAVHFEEDYDGNDAKITALMKKLKWACYLLVVEVVAFLLGVVGRR